MSEKTCLECSKPFNNNYPQAKFCTQECRIANYTRVTLGLPNGRSKLATGTTGAISELRVCADLLTKGYEVFRSVSQCASCDLAVLKDGKLYRIEVRTGYEHAKNGYFTNRPKKALADILAAVMPTRIVYEPPLS